MYCFCLRTIVKCDLTAPRDNNVFILLSHTLHAKNIYWSLSLPSHCIWATRAYPCLGSSCEKGNDLLLWDRPISSQWGQIGAILLFGFTHAPNHLIQCREARAGDHARSPYSRSAWHNSDLWIMSRAFQDAVYPSIQYILISSMDLCMEEGEMYLRS